MRDEFNDLITQKLKAGDKAIFNELFHSYYSPLCNHALRYLERDADAEEVVQQLFVHLWEKRSQLKPTVAIELYLYKAITNRCLNRIKHLKVRAKHAVEVKASSSIYSSESYEDVEYIELLKRVNQALHQLPEACKIVFQMSREEGLTYKQIAEKRKTSIKTIEGQMGKALKLMRQQLEDYLMIISFHLIFFQMA